jgi:hypothetical protein
MKVGIAFNPAKVQLRFGMCSFLLVYETSGSYQLHSRESEVLKYYKFKIGLLHLTHQYIYHFILRIPLTVASF